MHPDVSRQLFEEETKRITLNGDLLLDRGLLVLSCSYPDFVVASRHAASGRLRVFRFRGNDWNDTPASVLLIDGETGQELPGNLWPTDGSSHWHQGGWTSAAGIATNQPFMCMPGIREYHTHQSHASDLWTNYKSKPEFSLPNIVLHVIDIFQKSNV